MSRSGYSDADDPLAHGRWRQAVKRSQDGRRGQAMLRELVEPRCWPAAARVGLRRPMTTLALPRGLKRTATNC